MAKKTVKLPKRIGGVKIPKELRRKGGALLEQANSPAGRQVIAAGLSMAATAAATAAATVAQRRDAARPVLPVAPEAAATPIPPVPPRPGDAGIAAGLGDVQALTDALGNLADAALSRFFGAKRPG